MKKENTTILFEPDPNNLPKTDWSRFDAMSEEQRHQAALFDPDCPPATEAQLEKARRTSEIRSIRRALGLTQEEFAKRFELPLGSVRDWEQGSHKPDQAARVLLKVIAFDPQFVQQALHHNSSA